MNNENLIEYFEWNGVKSDKYWFSILVIFSILVLLNNIIEISVDVSCL